MPETHNHDHVRQHHARKANSRRLFLALGITVSFLAVEVFGAIFANSLSLLADAGHMLTDTAALGVALMASSLTARPHSALQSYGTLRAEILAALANGVGLLALAGYVFFAAAQRVLDPPVVDGSPMLAIAALGLAVNLVSAWVLMGGVQANLNMKAALTHVLTDAASSVGAMLAAALILAFRWYWADPIVGVLLGILLLVSSLRLIRPAVHILLEGTPHGMDLDELETCILAQAGVVQVHDLHAWTLTSGYNAVTAHVVVSEAVSLADREHVLDELRHSIPERFPVQHLTIQMEVSSDCCQETHMPGVAVHGHPSRPSHGSHHGRGPR